MSESCQSEVKGDQEQQQTYRILGPATGPDGPAQDDIAGALRPGQLNTRRGEHVQQYVAEYAQEGGRTQQQ